MDISHKNNICLPACVNPNVVSTKYLNHKDTFYTFDLKNMVIWFERAI